MAANISDWPMLPPLPEFELLPPPEPPPGSPAPPLGLGEGLVPGVEVAQVGQVILVMFVLIWLVILTIEEQFPALIPVPPPVLPLAELPPINVIRDIGAVVLINSGLVVLVDVGTVVTSCSISFNGNVYSVGHIQNSNKRHNRNNNRQG